MTRTAMYKGYFVNKSKICEVMNMFLCVGQKDTQKNKFQLSVKEICYKVVKKRKND
jgi:hypothetical protein